MLSDHTPVPALATSDLARARSFYEGVLGFTGEEQMDSISYPSGDSALFVYTSGFAGTNKATALTFDVDAEAFDEEVERLRAAGVAFDTFDLAEFEWVDGVATGEAMRAVWFRDPDGNILNVATMA